MPDIPDFKSYADVTARMSELREMLTTVNMLPVCPSPDGTKYGVSPAQKSAVVSFLLSKITEIGEAPTRESISREMIEIEKSRQSMERVGEVTRAVAVQCQAFLEAQKIKDGSRTNIPGA